MNFVECAVAKTEDDWVGNRDDGWEFCWIKAFEEAADGVAETGKECHVCEFACDGIWETEEVCPTGRSAVRNSAALFGKMPNEQDENNWKYDSPVALYKIHVVILAHYLKLYKSQETC